MEYHFGRLIDHVHLVVSDLDTSKKFYRAVLQSLGRDLSGEGEGYFFADELFVSPGDNITHVHLAFQTGDRDDVHRFFDAPRILRRVRPRSRWQQHRGRAPRAGKAERSVGRGQTRSSTHGMTLRRGTCR
jgi:catechol 2,3-dioxygenase-like lactoylglutathione lyase family enzyme